MALHTTDEASLADAQANISEDETPRPLYVVMFKMYGPSSRHKHWSLFLAQSEKEQDTGNIFYVRNTKDMVPGIFRRGSTAPRYEFRHRFEHLRQDRIQGAVFVTNKISARQLRDICAPINDEASENVVREDKENFVKWVLGKLLECRYITELDYYNPMQEGGGLGHVI